jgi:hypothetical protein
MLKQQLGEMSNKMFFSFFPLDNFYRSGPINVVKPIAHSEFFLFEIIH